MIRGKTVFEIPAKLLQLLRKVVESALPAVSLKGERGQRVGARGATDAEIDPTRKQPRQHAERLSDLEGTIMRKHHSSGADAHLRRERRDRTYQRLGTRARQHRRRMMFGDPVPTVAERFSEVRQVNAVP